MNRIGILIAAAALLAVTPCFAQNSSVIQQFQGMVGDATYSRGFCYTKMIPLGDGSGGKQANGCTWSEFHGQNWHMYHSVVEHWFFRGDGKIRLEFINGGDRPSNVNLVGTPEGSAISSIKWECPVLTWTGPPANETAHITGMQPAWVSIDSDISNIIYTCGTTNPGAYPTAKHGYTWFKRN